jgi:lipopolysaccharide/colanic/teichoic acid biosynthesis glycosyltransferase
LLAIRAILVIVAVLLLAGVTVAWAGNGVPAVPEASAALLAPLGIGALITFERRRRRLAKLHQGVGAAYRIIKRSLDILLSASLLLVSAPIFGLLALLVRLSGPGPIVFSRRVLGKNGKSFNMLKFRSMVVGAEEILDQDQDLKRAYYVNCKLECDPRVTKIGKLLRKTSMDELPQLINVFMGDMTFVGPRPIHADEVDIYGPNVERFKTVTPGVTGLWQTRGRSSISYEERVRMDMLYIEQRSVLLDLWIIVYTIPAVLLKRGAC